MNRRDLLARFGTVLAGASLGGCLGQYGGGAGGEGETTTAEGTTTGETTPADGTTGDGTTTGDGQETTNGRSGLVGKRFELVDVGCGEPTDEASVSFRPTEGSVVVSGSIPESNGCYVPTLADASYDPDAGTLVVTVASKKREGTQGCTQCITQMKYEATVEFEGGLPATVEVVHDSMGDSDTVATARSE